MLQKCFIVHSVNFSLHYRTTLEFMKINLLCTRNLMAWELDLSRYLNRARKRNWKRERMTEGAREEGGRYTWVRTYAYKAVHAKVQHTYTHTHTRLSKCLIQACGARCKVVPGECTWTLEENLARSTCHCLPYVSDRYLYTVFLAKRSDTAGNYLRRSAWTTPVVRWREKLEENKGNWKHEWQKIQ